MMSFTKSVPFLEENDVSRRAGKPIYAKDQANDSQTQRTGQTMVSSATVKTEYTASASIEGKSNFSDNNSSHPSENPFSINSHLTTPKNSYIPNIFINTPTNLSIINDDDESSTNDPNDTIDSPTTNTIKGRSWVKIPDLLKLYNPSTCFNKFLAFYNLQLLPSPQSIGSFLKFIQNEHPEYYSE